MIQARVLVEGEAQGLVLHLEEDLSFWGAIDPLTGAIIDRRHPQAGQSICDRVIVMRRSIGSSSGSAVLLETLQRGVGPAGIILAEPDQILTLGAVVSREMGYGNIPVLQLGLAHWAGLRGEVRINRQGGVRVLGSSC